jgi:hypothetical protein
LTSLRHDTWHWQENSRGYSFAAEAGADIVRFNRILWKGMKGRGVPYPAVRDRREPRRSRERLLTEYCRAESVVLPHLSRERQTFEVHIATLNGELADDTSKTAVAFVTGGSARCICLGGGVAYFLSRGGRQAKIPEGSKLVLVFNRDRKIPTHLTDDRQQYLIRDQTHRERSKRWSPTVSMVCGGQHPCSISELHRQAPNPALEPILPQKGEL